MSLRNIFDQLSIEVINQMIADGQEEHLRLDFKRINNSNLNGADYKKNIAKSISGFANSSGGIVIWGVDAKKNELEVACAFGAVHLTQLAQFISRLNEITSIAASPMVEGIESRAFDIGNNTGFAATLIPESDAGPHMAKLGEDRYYKRNGQSFYKLEHFDLEDMFGRRQKPNLSVNFLQKTENLGDKTLRLEINLVNDGKAIARHSGIFIEFTNSEIFGISGLNLHNLSSLNDGRAIVGYDNSHGVIHPNGIQINIGYVSLVKKNIDEKIEVSYKLYCENMQARSESLLL